MAVHAYNLSTGEDGAGDLEFEVSLGILTQKTYKQQKTSDKLDDPLKRAW
jgi:hypothetical protein